MHMIISIPYACYLAFRTYKISWAWTADKILPIIYNQMALNMKGDDPTMGRSPYQCYIYRSLEGAITHLSSQYSHQMITLAFNHLIEDGGLPTYYTPEMEQMHRVTKVLWIGIAPTLVIDYLAIQSMSIDYSAIYDRFSTEAIKIRNTITDLIDTSFYSIKYFISTIEFHTCVTNISSSIYI